MQRLKYKDERSADLRLHLFRGDVDLEAFPVLTRQGRSIAGVEVDACIIGASHAVQFRAGDEILTEVLACRAKAVDRFDHRLSGVWRLGEEVRAPAGESIGYGFESQVVPLAAADRALADFRRSIDQAEGAGSIGLRFRFPSKTAEAAETLLHVAGREQQLTIRSAHVYPQEGAAVLSRTVLEVAPTSLGPESGRHLLEVETR